LGEPRTAVFDPESKTHAATYDYIREFVGRYRNDPTVLLWELENEAFLKADVVVEGKPGLPAGVFSDGATMRRETYDSEDNLRFEQLVNLYQDVTAFIKELDPNHLVTSGDSGVREESMCRRTTFPRFKWKDDTLREHLSNLLASQPEPLDVFSLHMYGNFTSQRKVGDLSHLDFLVARVRAIHASRSPVFIGELGQRDPHFKADPEAKWTRAAIDALDREGVALIALWAWHFPWQDKDHNIPSGASQPLLMERVAEFNRQHARMEAMRQND
jgi:endo-1,4-beta-mannosidase